MAKAAPNTFLNHFDHFVSVSPRLSHQASNPSNRLVDHVDVLIVLMSSSKRSALELKAWRAQLPNFHMFDCPCRPVEQKLSANLGRKKHKMTKFGLPLDFTRRGADRRSPLFHSALFFRDFKRLIFSYYDVTKQFLSRKSRMNVCLLCIVRTATACTAHMYVHRTRKACA